MRRGWLLPVAGLAFLLIAVAAGWISRAIVIDFLAWWPVWLALAILASLTRGRKWGRVHLPALMPLVTVGALAVFFWAYLAGWEAIPSAVNRLNGPVEGPATTASMTAQIDGKLDVTSSDLGFLYSVVPLRGGGDIGLPTAREETQGASTRVVLLPASDSGLYTFSGWDLQLSKVPIWNVSLSGAVDADVSGLVLSRLRLIGSGSVLFGSPPADVPVFVSGQFGTVFPAGVPVRIVGSADVPESWRETPDGWASPSSGSGWVLTVADGSSVLVEES